MYVNQPCASQVSGSCADRPDGRRGVGAHRTPRGCATWDAPRRIQSRTSTVSGAGTPRASEAARAGTLSAAALEVGVGVEEDESQGPRQQKNGSGTRQD